MLAALGLISNALAVVKLLFYGIMGWEIKKSGEVEQHDKDLTKTNKEDTDAQQELSKDRQLSGSALDDELRKSLDN